MSVVGVHVITTTYGQWLPGDDRGHWSPLFDLYGRLIARGCRLNPPDETSRRHAEAMMREPARTLDITEQMLAGLVVASLVDSPGFSRGPVVINRGPERISPAKAGANYPPPVCHACAIEHTHAHFLFGPIAEPIERFVGRLKGLTSAALLKLPQNHGRSRTWSTGYWKVFLFDPEAALAVQRYIEQHNERRDLPAQRFSFVQPMRS